jgi:hypothetical protein
MNNLLKKDIIENIEKLADQKELEIKRNYYYKYHKFYDLCIFILKRHDVLLYGGTAINEIFPEPYKFYSKEELPDIDIFCTDYKPISEDILRTFKKYGYKLTEVKEALHENTYRVFAEGLQLLDISVISKDFFKTLKRHSVKTKLGISTVNIDYLKYSLHLILSEPLDSWRWTKVYQRMVKLYTVYPIDTTCSLDISKYYVQLPKELNTFIKKIIDRYHLIAFGWDVIQTYLQEDATISNSVKRNFITKDIDSFKDLTPIRYLLVDKDSDKIVNYITKHSDLKVEYIYPGDDVLPKYYTLTYKNQRCIYLFESSTCVSFIDWRSTMILSIHATIQHLYAMYLSTHEEDIKCIIQLLTAIQMNNALSSKKLFKQFVLNCYGFQKGIVTLRKERLLRKIKSN